jgi:hypothetical protein
MGTNVLEEPAASVFGKKSMEATSSSKMLAPMYLTAWQHIPEDCNLNNFERLGRRKIYFTELYKTY